MEGQVGYGKGGSWGSKYGNMDHFGDIEGEFLESFGVLGIVFYRSLSDCFWNSKGSIIGKFGINLTLKSC